MGKRGDIDQLTNLMAMALRHRIGSIVNKDELYANKYAKDADVLMREAEKILINHTWNNYDRKEIKEQLRKKLHKELAEKDFLDNKKFEIIDIEINKALKSFDLV